jgi:DNA-binding CsgD family transcriptional regulator
VIGVRDQSSPSVYASQAVAQVPDAGDGPVLRGRGRESASLEALLDGVRAGRSGVLVLRGEPGVGKSALLESTTAAVPGVRVLRAAGIESEMELAFAGLHQLCVPIVDGLDRLPAPQRDALGAAFGLTAGVGPDRFLVGLAVLTLLSDAAGEQPLVCVVDDLQWLDRASRETLAFVARRLLADPVGMILATREAADELTGLPELTVAGLSVGHARGLLDSMFRAPVDEHVRDRILAETRGNPLALIELSREITSAELAGFATADTPLATRIEESFRQRVEPLPDDTRRLLLAAAADPSGDVALLRRACEQLGISADEAVLPASDAGLFTLGARATFFHPLVRSAVYRTATTEARAEVHQALAEATDPVQAPERRAWHRAQASTEPDEDVALELERCAGRAGGRGGLAAAAALLERSVALTANPARRSERALAAAQAQHSAGAPDAALDLLAIADLGPLDELQRARAERLRARLAFAQRRGSDAPPLLLRAARRLQPLDPALARETYLEALAAALTTGERDSLTQAFDALRATPAPSPVRATELLMTGQALRVVEGGAAGIPVLERALRAFRSEPLEGEDEMRALLFACAVAQSLWDDESWWALPSRYVSLAREAGALSALPIALEMQCASQVDAGQLAAAQDSIEEAQAIADATGSPPMHDGAVRLAALRGAQQPALERVEAAIRDATDRGEATTITGAEYAAAILYNGLGRHDAALGAAQRACDHHPAKAYPRALSEMVEAAARSGEPERAARALDQLQEGTTVSGTDWALGVEARSRALISEGEAADALYREAIDRLGRTRVRVEHARARLLYGEWLRRGRRRLEARAELRAAHESFIAIGAAAFAARAARELLATGETARKRTVESSDRLTPQETQIARLARDGLSNPEIGSRLFISPRTVEYHLHKVFSKLDIGSRSQLEQALPAEPQAVS